MYSHQKTCKGQVDKEVAQVKHGKLKAALEGALGEDVQKAPF
jgi:hypothetical protein